MTGQAVLASDPDAAPAAPRHDFGAKVSLQAGAVRLEASAHCSALGFAAIGALVSAILLSVPPIIRAARQRS